MAFEYIQSKKYLYWTTSEFVEEMKLLHASRSRGLVAELENQGISLAVAIQQVEQKSGIAYDLFSKLVAVGGDDFFQEIFACLSFVDFLGNTEVEGVGFPVKSDCPEDVHLTELKDWLENNSEYDFVIKKNGSFNCFQLKTAPERYIKEFSAEYFIKDIVAQTNKYSDPQMILLYLLQPFQERDSTEKFYKMIDEICAGIGNDLTVKNILFVGRRDLENYEYTQVYKEVARYSIPLSSGLYAQIRNNQQTASS